MSKGVLVNAFVGGAAGLHTIIFENLKYTTHFRYEANSDFESRSKGEPGEVVVTVQNKGQTVFLTKIGDDGKAEVERHVTDHNRPKKHSNPHDHYFVKDKNGNDTLGKPTNYWSEEPPKL